MLGILFRFVRVMFPIAALSRFVLAMVFPEAKILHDDVAGSVANYQLLLRICLTLPEQSK